MEGGRPGVGSGNMRQGANGQDDVPLDVRMRNLILKNAEKSQDEEVIARALQSSSASAPAQNLSGQSNAAHKLRQKRPNQAERRQKSSQFNVPIDPRATQPQSYRSYGNTANQSYRQNYNDRNQRPHPSSFQPSNPNDGLARGELPSHGHHQPSPSYPGFSSSPAHHDWRHSGGGHNGHPGDHGPARSNHPGRHSTGQARSLYNPQQHPPRPDNLEAQIAMLEHLSAEILTSAEIGFGQIQEKERFRLLIEDACRVHITQYENEINGRSDFSPFSVHLRCFGSLASGFATKASDMDLGLLSPCSLPQPDATGSQIPRIVEKTLLDMGFGARLLSKTRVPIIKVCEKPPPKLRADLLEEREKWERGEEDQEPEEEELVDGRASTPDDNVVPAAHDGANDNRPRASSKQLHESSDQDGSKDQYQTLLDGLKQGSKSMSSYYGAAKKLLRTLGGRDYMNSTAENFSANDYRTLNDVCAAFVRGLADHDLKSRLQRYASLSFDTFTAMVSPNRTIYGVMAQIEGEKMVMAWDSRSVHEKDQHAETMALSRVEQWKSLQNRPTFGQDPLAYNKELQLANDTLKRVPSIGLLLLEQSQYETAASYHSRAIKLMIELGGHDSPASQSPVLPVVIQQYARGIYDFDIRSQVSDFQRSMPYPSLRAVARRHKALQLAREFDKALENNLYPPETAEAVRQYLELLRKPLESNLVGDAHFDFVLPMTPESWTLVARIRDIQDPSRMTPNQPRDPYKDKLEFPKSDIGVQCDINFSAQLALHNTRLLRCYSLTDPRVRPLVLFVKHWAKVRGINTPYRGTLSSYGYVLMVLHYLINVARPYVCPNLQLLAPPVPPNLTPEQLEDTVQCKGRDVRFWGDEVQIQDAAQQGALNQNKDSIGLLLRGFFEYYAQNNMMTAGHMRGFDWGRDVISIRTQGGTLSKGQKGWTGAKTVFEVRASDKPPASEPAPPKTKPSGLEAEGSSQGNIVSQTLPSTTDATTASKPLLQERGKSEVKEVRHRYLFAIEDPFELDHNVARTVTHNGIVSIRDEFRRAWRIIKNAGRGNLHQQENLLQDASLEKKANQSSFWELLDEIHGKPQA